jgi:hypothetical protein
MMNMKTNSFFTFFFFIVMIVSSGNAQNVKTASGDELALNNANNAPGWYFVRWEYVKSNADGAKTGHFANGDPYTEVNTGKGEKNDFTVSVTRIDKNKKTIATGTARTIWSDPPTFFSANDLPAITVNRTVESSWGISQFSITFDMKDTNPGGGSYGKINFATPKGETHIQAFEGIMKAKKMIKGNKQGEQRAIILHINGYGFKYYYEWRE